MKIRLSSKGITDVGRTRKQNEDNFFCDTAAGLFIVADGMGGGAAGETASKIVVTLLPIMLQKSWSTADPPMTIADMLTDNLCRLSEDLYRKSQNMPTLQGLGSTAVMLLIREHTVSLAYVGDSRGYLLRDAQLRCLTEDQTTAAALVRTGYLQPEAAEHHPLKHSLEEYIGKDGPIHPGIRQERLVVGDRWLLCSDGVSKALNDATLHDILLEHPTPEAACQRLITKANTADGTDNITAVVVDINENPKL